IDVGRLAIFESRLCFFFPAEDGIRAFHVTGVQTCALPILSFFGALVAVFGRNLPAVLRADVLSVQGFIGATFLLFILTTSNPFKIGRASCRAREEPSVDAAAPCRTSHTV